MFCTRCGSSVADGAHFCQSCGAALQVAGGIRQQPYSPAPAMPRDARSRAGKAPDPYKDQIQQLKLQIRQLKLDLKQITTQMSNIRANYHETSAFVPRGLLHWGNKAMEDFRLLGPQQQKEQLQREIMQFEQQLLGLQQAQTQWKANN